MRNGSGRSRIRNARRARRWRRPRRPPSTPSSTSSSRRCQRRGAAKANSTCIRGPSTRSMRAATWPKRRRIRTLRRCAPRSARWTSRPSRGETRVTHEPRVGARDPHAQGPRPAGWRRYGGRETMVRCRSTAAARSVGPAANDLPETPEGRRLQEESSGAGGGPRLIRHRGEVLGHLGVTERLRQRLELDERRVPATRHGGSPPRVGREPHLERTPDGSPAAGKEIEFRRPGGVPRRQQQVHRHRPSAEAGLPTRSSTPPRRGRPRPGSATGTSACPSARSGRRPPAARTPRDRRPPSRTSAPPDPPRTPNKAATDAGRPHQQAVHVDLGPLERLGQRGFGCLDRGGVRRELGGVIGALAQPALQSPPGEHLPERSRSDSSAAARQAHAATAGAWTEIRAPEPVIVGIERATLDLDDQPERPPRPAEDGAAPVRRRHALRCRGGGTDVHRSTREKSALHRVPRPATPPPGARARRSSAPSRPRRRRGRPHHLLGRDGDTTGAVAAPPTRRVTSCTTRCGCIHAWRRPSSAVPTSAARRPGRVQGAGPGGSV